MNKTRFRLTERTRRVLAYFFAAIAFVTCPCHLPIFALLFAGTAAGAALSAHFALSAVTLAAVFAVSLAIAIAAFRSQP